MAQDKTEDWMQGALVPMKFTSANIWTAQTTATQQGPEAAVSTPENEDNPLEIVGGGSLESGDSYDFRVQRSGVPGFGQNSALEIVWKNTTDDDDEWRGHEWSALAAKQCLKEGDTGDYSDLKNPHTLALSDGRALCVFEAYVSANPNTQRDIVLKVLENDGGWGSDIEVFAYDAANFNYGGAALQDDLFPCIWAHPDGKTVLIAHWLIDPSDYVAQIQILSADTSDLTTWTVVSRAALPIAVPHYTTNAASLGRIRIQQTDAGALLMYTFKAYSPGTAGTDCYGQAFSLDGLRFTGLDTSNGEADSDVVGNFDILVSDGTFVVVYLGQDGTTDRVYARRLTAPSQSFSNATVITVSTESYFTTGGSNPTDFTTRADIAACVGDDGRLWVTFPADGDVMALLNSRDGGLTWERPLSSRWLKPNTAFQLPYDLTMCFSQGRLICVHRDTYIVDLNGTNTRTELPDLYAAYIGGSSQVVVPDYYSTGFYGHGYQVQMVHNYLARSTPADNNWTQNLTGSATEIIYPDYYDQTVTSGNTLTYNLGASYRPTAGVSEGFGVRVCFRVASGGSVLANDLGFSMTLADGSESYQVFVRFEASAPRIRIFDTSGASTPVKGTINISTVSQVEMFCFISDQGFVAWYRTGDIDQLCGNDRTWTQICDATLVDQTTTFSNNDIEFGNFNGASSSIVRWYWLNFWDNESQSPVMNGYSNPSSLRGRLLASRGGYSGIDAGLRVWGSGRGVEGEETTLTPRYRYPVERVLPGGVSTPKIQWRSEAEASATTTISSTRIAISMNPDNPGDALQDGLTDAIGIIGAETNFRYINLQRYNGSSWATIESLDLGKYNFSSVTRSGYTLRGGTPDANTDSVWFSYNELKGWIAEIDDGVDIIHRRIKGNSAGRLDSNYLGKEAIIELESYTDDDPDSSISLTLIPTRWAAIVRLKEAQFAALALQFPDQTTIDGELRAGALWPATFYAFGFPYSWGSVTEGEANVERRIMQDGTTRNTKFGEYRRTFRIGWVDGLDHAAFDVFGGPELDYLAFDSGVPIATYDDVPYLWEGLLRETDGPILPICLLRRVTGDIDSYQIFSRRREFMIAEITGTAQDEIIQGDPGDNEVIRMAPITGEEWI